MKKPRIYQILFTVSIVCVLLSGLVRTGKAQVVQDTAKINRSDTTQVKREFEQQNKKEIPNYLKYDRSIHKYLMSENQRFNVPTSERYYSSYAKPDPLNAAMKALRDEFTHRILDNIFSSTAYKVGTRVLPFIPFVSKYFFFRSYDHTLDLVSPFNSYLYPQTLKGRYWDRYMEYRFHSIQND